MSRILNRCAVAVLALFLPMVALADINDTKTLAANTALNLDSDTTASSGGDLLWTGTQLSFQGKAKGGSLSALGLSGASQFASLNLATLQALAQFASTAPIPASGLSVNTIVAVLTNAGNGAKLLVTAQSGTSITLQFTTFGATAGGGGGGPAVPTITKILNNYSLIPNGFVNSNVAPSTIVAVFGTNLGDPPPASGLALNTTAGSGLPTTSANASASISAGGKNYPMYLYYASPGQMAGVIPAAVPPGPATLTVTYNGQPSAPFSFTIVANALGLGTYNGVIIATDAVTGVLVDYTHTAIPGRTYVFWGSGGGSDPKDSDFQFSNAPQSVNQSSTQFFFGSKQGTVLYSGSSGFPGLMQMNVTLPVNSDTGCGVTAVGVVNGVPSNFGPIPIDASGICHDPIFGLDGTTINSYSGSTTVKSGSLIVGSFVQPAPAGTNNIAEASFSKNTGSGYVSAGFTSFGSCSVLETPSGGNNTGTSTPLDVGSVQLLDANGNTSTLQALIKGTYLGQLAANAIVPGGTYKFTVSGGADGGTGTVSLSLPSPLLTPTNVPTSIDHTQALATTWSGGAAGSYVLISGSSTNTNTGVSGSFTCWAPQSALGFVVPQPVVDVLPAGSGTLTFENATLPVKGNLQAIDQVFAFGVTLNGFNVTYK
jgi:uncharacterized protein (TIGR03437 family)